MLFLPNVINYKIIFYLLSGIFFYPLEWGLRPFSKFNFLILDVLRFSNLNLFKILPITRQKNTSLNSQLLGRKLMRNLLQIKSRIFLGWKEKNIFFSLSGIILLSCKSLFIHSVSISPPPLPHTNSFTKLLFFTF